VAPLAGERLQARRITACVSLTRAAVSQSTIVFELRQTEHIPQDFPHGRCGEFRVAPTRLGTFRARCQSPADVSRPYAQSPRNGVPETPHIYTEAPREAL
jgi:hypothetical protein